MSLTGKIRLNVEATDSRTADLETATSPTSLSATWAITSGTGLNQANIVWSDERTLTTGANEDLDVSGGLTGLFGAVPFVKIKGVIFVANAANTTSLTVSRPAANGVPLFAAASDAVVLTPGGFFVLVDPSAAGIAVTAGTGDLINVLNGAGASATYRVGLIGTNA